MFNDRFGLTDAVLKGRKTMTRRICRVKATGEIIYTEEVESVWLHSNGTADFVMKNGEIKESVLPYKVGEIVSVAQSYKDLCYSKEWVEQHIRSNPQASRSDKFEKRYPGWSNKMFVPAELNKASKIRMVNVMTQPLRDIRDADCIKEGIEKYWGYRFRTPHGVCIRSNPRDAFAALIDAVSGEGTWRRNPYTYAYNFELVTNLFNFS